MSHLEQIPDRPGHDLTVIAHGMAMEWSFTKFKDSLGTQYVKKQRHMGSHKAEVKWFILNEGR